MKLICKRCSQVIEPEEAMIVVVVDQPMNWTSRDQTVQRLEFARGRWHYRCAPVPVKRYASAVMPRRAKENE
jgi:hypothetical protein